LSLISIIIALIVAGVVLWLTRVGLGTGCRVTTIRGKFTIGTMTNIETMTNMETMTNTMTDKCSIARSKRSL
jgi:hypothetical protein